MRARGRLIAAYVEHVGCRVRGILDVGCGMGRLRATLLRALPRASYTGLEVSDYLCERYGWVNGSIADYAPDASSISSSATTCFSTSARAMPRAASRTSGGCAAACCISRRSPRATGARTATAAARMRTCTCAKPIGIAGVF